MTPEQRERAIECLNKGEDLAPEWECILFPPERREYELVYHGKEREGEVIADTMSVPLQPVRTFGKNGNGWNNMLIFGGNLQVLKTLLDMKARGKLTNADGSKGVRLIYIDPPFASKREFQGSQEQKAYQDKIAGASFVEYVRKRLVMLRELLADEGSIFLHTDQRKGHYLKVVMDEVFGENNFRNEIVLPGRASKNLQQQFKAVSRLNVRHDTLLWYSASPKTRFSPLWVEKHKAGNPEGHFHHFWSNANRPKMRYELFGITPETGQWTWKKPRALKAVGNYERYLEEAGGRTLAEYWRDTGCALEFIRKDEEGKPQYWRAPAETRIADTMWSGIPIYSSSTGYPTEKNEALLRQIVDLASSEGDIVLDAFAGSGTAMSVAEKMNRRWVGIDCSKLSIYTIQKRLLNLRKKIGKQVKPLTAKPFTLYNAGLYDFCRLRELPWEDWRFFALQLFQCKDQAHRIGGIQLDGTLKGAPVLVFNHVSTPGAKVTYETIDDLHQALGNKIGRRFFIVAPSLSFAFQEDRVPRGDTMYYALRIPYSIIAELHRREFTAMRQPMDEKEVNETVDSVGFDFIRTPDATVKCRLEQPKGDLFQNVCITIKKFASETSPGQPHFENLESLSMVLVDENYDGEVFDLDHCFFAEQLRNSEYKIQLGADSFGEQFMVVLIDVFGNEARELLKMPQLSNGSKRTESPPTQESVGRRARKPSAKKPSAKKRHKGS